MIVCIYLFDWTEIHQIGFLENWRHKKVILRLTDIYMSESFSQYYLVYVMHSWVKMMVLELDLEVYEVRVMDFPLFLEYISLHHAMDAVVFLQRFFSREISFDFWLIILKAANTYYICQVLQFQQKKKSSFYLLLVPKKGL